MATPTKLPGLSEPSTTVFTVVAGTHTKKLETARISGATKSMCSSRFVLYHSMVAYAAATQVNSPMKEVPTPAPSANFLEKSPMSSLGRFASSVYRDPMIRSAVNAMNVRWMIWMYLRLENLMRAGAILLSMKSVIISIVTFLP